MRHEIMWFLLCWIFFLLFFFKRDSFIFLLTQNWCVYMYIIYREKEREKGRERLAWLFYCMIWVILPVTFSLWSTFLGMFIVVVVSTTQLKCSYNTSLLEETCNESESRKWKVVNNEGFCVYIRVCHKKVCRLFSLGTKKKKRIKVGLPYFFVSLFVHKSTTCICF